MRTIILTSSPRRKGNTLSLLKPFADELKARGIEVKQIDLFGKNIKACIACRECQKDWSKFGCIHKDDLDEIFYDILNSDLIILATPIYSWYCTPPMKALLDRLVYGMNKYYGEEKGPSLWAGKNLALITTCGYPPEKGADLWEDGMKRYANHSQLNYLGMLVEHDLGYKYEFMDEEKEKNSIGFARKLLKKH